MVRLLRPPAGVTASQADAQGLFVAIQANDVQQVTQALDNGAPVDSTAEFVKATHPRPEHGPWPRETVTALTFAIMLKKRGRIARLLLERGANSTRMLPGGITALYTCVKVADARMIAALAAAGDDVNVATTKGITPLWLGESRSS